MLIQLDWRFWLCVFAIFVAIRLRPPIQSSTWWGLLNAGALVLLLGLRGAGLLAAGAVALWAILRFGAKHEESRPGINAYAAAAIAVGLALAWQKILFEITAASGPSAPFVGSIQLLGLIAFSYVALRAWDAISAVRDGERLLNPLALLGYLAPFFMMPAGPINVYREHLAVDEADLFAPPSWPALLKGAEFIVYGLFMKFVLAAVLRLYVVGVNGDWPTRNYWDSLITFLYIYLDFAGYSLLALGIGRLLGVPTPVNFDRPLLATSLTDFWTRWHMSLGNWVKRNIYFPSQLFLLRRTPEAAAYWVNTLSLMLGFTFVGLWHRVTWQFLLWGVLFGCLLSIEKVLRDKVLGRAFGRWPALGVVARCLAPIYVILVVVAMLHLTAMGQMVGNSK